MKRKILLISVLLFSLLLFLVGFGSWLFQSTAGTDWLIGVVADVAELRITTGQLEGRLADELTIEDLTVVWQGVQLTVQRIHLNWVPSRLLQGKVDVRSLAIDQLVIHQTGSPEASEPQAVKEDGGDFAAADLVFLPAWLEVEITRLQIQGIAYQDDEGTAVIADELSGSYLWSQEQINAPDFSYISPYVHLRGSFELDLQDPHMDVTAEVHLPESLVDRQLFDDIAAPVTFPGKIDFDGDWNNFYGPVSFGTATDADGTVWLAADARGSWQGIRFDNFRGRYLNGDLTGELDLAWIDSYRMHGELTGTGIDPGVFVEELSGQAHLDVSGDLIISYDDQPLQAKLAAKIHEGQLRGHALSGKLSADWQGGGLHEIDLDLRSEEARVVAHGKPAGRVELDLNVADLSPFHPGLAGELLATGWLNWSDDYLTGAVDGSATAIIWQDSSLDSLRFQASHLALQTPLQLELAGHGLQYDGTRVDHLQLDVTGTVESHDVRVAMDSFDADLEAQLTGHYRDEVWQAELAAMSGQTPVLGAWALEEPAGITWQSQSLSLKNFSLASSRKERVAIELSRLLATTDSQLSLTWHDLRHDWLAYLQLPLEITGKSSGELQLELDGQQPVSLQAQLIASAVTKDDLAEVVIPSLTAEAVWLQDGLALDIKAESDTGESILVTGRSSRPPSGQWPPDELSLDMRWQKVNLERISRFGENLEVQGHSDGNAQVEILAGKLMRASASVRAEGLIQQDSQHVGLHSLLAELDWDEKSFHCDVQAKGIDDGLFTLNLTSTDDPSLYWPISGRIDMKIDTFNLQSLTPVLPPGASFDGVVSGQSSGYWQEDGQLFLEGQAGLSEGDLIWHDSDGQVDITIQNANVEWQWQGDHLKGSMTLLLAEQGELHGRWQLPLPARWPVALDVDGELQAEVHGEMHATGLIVALAPGLIQDLQGQVKTELHATGSLRNPMFSGRMTLTDASAYLPVSGVTIEDLKLRVALQGDKLNLEELSLRSGPGTVSGTGGLDFDQWQLEQYRLTLEGERLQVYNFPELQILCSPDLTLTGSPEGMQLRGNLLIPEMSLLGTGTTPEFLPSNDVVISSDVADDRKALPVGTDIQVVVELGDQVWVKTAGIDTRLEGGSTVALDEQRHLATWGEIHLVEGVYKAYGANLDIKQGVLSFDGGPIDNPKLRIFAARDVGTVQAGVQITGTAEAPVVTLYSRPAMPERDIIGYIFMGRPMRAGQEGEDALMIGAGALMPRYGETFSDLGISEVDIQGLFDGSGGVRLRRHLTESWELVSTLGSESGIDLYYIFKLD